MKHEDLIGQKVLITGGPKAGKTTFAGPDAKHTDDLIETLKWSEQSEAVSHWFDEEGPWIIEGVSIPRALRKWLERNPEGKPADVLLYLNGSKIPLNEGQQKMYLSVRTVFNEVKPELIKREVRIVEQ
jgi:hypothetical protein